MDNLMLYIPTSLVPGLEAYVLQNLPGYTLIPGCKGVWHDDDGTRYVDDITLLQVFTDTTDAVVGNVSHFVLSNGEKSFLYTKNGVPHFIP